MKHSNNNLRVEKTIDKKSSKDQEGSLQTIETPQEKNAIEVLKTESELEKEDSKRKGKRLFCSSKKTT